MHYPLRDLRLPCSRLLLYSAEDEIVGESFVLFCTVFNQWLSAEIRARCYSINEDSRVSHAGISSRETDGLWERSWTHPACQNDRKRDGRNLCVVCVLAAMVSVIAILFAPSIGHDTHRFSLCGCLRRCYPKIFIFWRRTSGMGAAPFLINTLGGFFDERTVLRALLTERRRFVIGATQLHKFV